MQRLENGGVRIEYYDFINDIYLYKDITLEMAKTFTKRTKILIDNIPRLKENDLKYAYHYNEYAECKTFGKNGCAVEVTHYSFENGRGRDHLLYPQFIYYDLKEVVTFVDNKR